MCLSEATRPDPTRPERADVTLGLKRLPLRGKLFWGDQEATLLWTVQSDTSYRSRSLEGGLSGEKWFKKIQSY